MGQAPDETHLDPSEIHDVLRNDRRRLVLDRLRTDEEAAAVRDLAEYIAAVESGERPAPRNVRQSVYISLHQTHLPKLDELGIAEYDADEKVVRLAERAGEVSAHMVDAPDEEPRPSTFLLLVGSLGLVTAAAGTLGGPPVSDLTVLLTGGLFALLVLAAFPEARRRGRTVVHRLRA